MEIAKFSATALMENVCKSAVYTANTLIYNTFCISISNSFSAETYKNNSFYTCHGLTPVGNHTVACSPSPPQ